MTAYAINPDGSYDGTGLAIYACYNLETEASAMTMMENPGPDVVNESKQMCR